MVHGNTLRRTEPSSENLARARQAEWLRCTRLRRPADVRRLDAGLRRAYERKRVDAR
jgi:hypothetical protein